MEASGFYHYTIKKRYLLYQEQKAKIQDIEDLLALCISPNDHSFSLKELQNQFNFPQEDIDEAYSTYMKNFDW